jgi:hypothetical protein
MGRVSPRPALTRPAKKPVKKTRPVCFNGYPFHPIRRVPDPIQFFFFFFFFFFFQLRLWWHVNTPREQPPTGYGMGNKIARTIQVSASEYNLHDLPSSYNLVLKEVLGRGRFFKSILCKHDEGLVLVKVYFKRGDFINLREYKRRLFQITEIFRAGRVCGFGLSRFGFVDFPCKHDVWPFQIRVFLTKPDPFKTRLKPVFS